MHDSNISSISAPVLFLLFNRPDTTSIVFEKICQVKPKKLFIAADGPRDNYPEDIINCEKARAIVDLIDWDCDVKLLFREKNLGCGIGVSSAITWFFDHVEYGIILEDDCVPDISFFYFCQNLLEKYRDNSSIMMIAGTSYFLNKVQSKHTYFFAKNYPIWGWATWKRAWQQYDFTLHDWSTEKRDEFKKFLINKNIIDHWSACFDQIKHKKLDTWDIQWAYACIKNNGYSIMPYTNMISNIGLRGAHANGKKSAFHEMPVGSVGVEYMVHPARVVVNNAMNKKTYHNIFKVIRPYYTVQSKIRYFVGYTVRAIFRFVGIR